MKSSRLSATRTNRTVSQHSGAAASTDAQRLDFIEQAARKSYTGISFDWIPSVEGEPSGFRFMRQHNIGEPHKNIRAAIDAAMRVAGQS